jgi:hypothetical protein
MNWIDLAQDRERWRALVVAVMNLLVPKKCEESCLAEEMLASQVGLCCME